MVKTVGFIATLVLSVFLHLPAFADPLEVSLAVTDITGLEELQREFLKFQEVLSEKSGLKFKLYPVTSRTAVVEALAAQRVDFVLTGPAEYVVIRKKTNAQPIVGFSRPDYYSSVIVMADSGINSVSDLKGKKVGFGDVGSTSYHLAPLQLIKDGGINPRDDIRQMFLGKQIAWNALKKGDVQALGMNHERYAQFRDAEKTLPAGAFRVIARGPDLPNDVLVAGAHLSPEIIAKVQETFSKYSDEIVAAVMVGKRNDKYNGLKFVTNIQDSNYNYVRSMYETAGYPEFSEFVGNG